MYLQTICCIQVPDNESLTLINHILKRCSGCMCFRNSCRVTFSSPELQGSWRRSKYPEHRVLKTNLMSFLKYFEGRHFRLFKCTRSEYLLQQLFPCRDSRGIFEQLCVQNSVTPEIFKRIHRIYLLIFLCFWGFAKIWPVVCFCYLVRVLLPEESFEVAGLRGKNKLVRRQLGSVPVNSAAGSLASRGIARSCTTSCWSSGRRTSCLQLLWPCSVPGCCRMLTHWNFPT